MSEITEKPKILLVDDEKNILNSLNRLFFDENYEILLANSARKALEVLGILEVNVIISDQRMPNMTGVEMLTRAQQLQPDAVRMILTGYADIEAAIQAVNEGAVFRFLSKPWNDDELKMAVKQSVEHYRIQKKNKELFALNQKQNVELKTLNDTLNQRVKERTKTIIQKNQELSAANKQLSESFFKLINIIIEIVETKSSDLASHCKRVAASARYIAEELELPEEEIEMIEIAAMLHDIGKISMSDQVLLKRDTMMNSEELNLWKRHPLVGERILGNIDRLNEV
ncbi:MAG: response regulator, partial [FCB group bacterium]|nr:response regulator [FCB group bacterium]